MKRPRAAVAPGDDPVARLRREARVVAQLEHAGIAPVYALEGDGDATRYVARHVEGRTLAEEITDARADAERQPGRADAARLAGRLEAFVRVCDAVAFAHEKRVAHRDLRPAHVVLGAHHQVVVRGWEHARVLDERDASDESTPRSSSMPRGDLAPLVGDPTYMAPEQVERRDAAVDERTDVFTLGLVLQELLTLRPARAGLAGDDLFQAAYAGDRAAATRLASGAPIPAPLRAIVDKAASLRRPERYASAAWLAVDLRAWLAGDVPSAYVETRSERVRRWAHRRAMGLLVLAVTATLVAVAFAAALGAREARRSWDAAARAAAPVTR